MKLELPFAILLLAAGCWLWNARTNASNTGIDAASPSTPAKVAQASFQQDIGQVARTSNANQLIQQSAFNLLNSTPIQAKARIHIDLFDQPVVATGRYFQQGQGSERSRFELQQGTGENAIEVMQLFDGRFFYTKQTIAGESSLNYVDLQKVEETSSMHSGFLGASGNLMCTGSVSSLLKNLSAAFDFSEPVTTELGGIPMVSCRGTWKQKVLQQILADLVDPRDLNPVVNWDAVPVQVPCSVVITLGNDQYLPLFPYRVVFHRPVKGELSSEQQILRLDLFEVGKLDRIPDEIFNIDSADLQPFDATPVYVERVQRYQELHQLKQQAEHPAESTLR